MAMYMKDSDGNVQEVGFTNEVDRSKWKLLAETEITQEMIDEAGEEGITNIVIDFGAPIKEWYGETWIRANFGATTDLNSADSGIRCGFAKYLNEIATRMYPSGTVVALAMTAQNAQIFYKYRNIISLFTNWHNGNNRGTIFMNNGYGERTYPYIAYATSSTEGADDDTVGQIIGCQYLYFSNAGRTFKFPAGTTLKIYGRF